MKIFRCIIVLAISALIIWLNTEYALAEDLILQGQLQTNIYTSDGIIRTQNTCEVLPETQVKFEATSFVLSPGFRVKSGGIFSVNNLDPDGLPNAWEIQYFGNLEQNPDGENGDYDGDGLTNFQEYLFGTDPTNPSDDHDNDELPDVWEAQYGDLSSLNGRDEDSDGDGISNWIEYCLKTDPTIINSKGPGLHYQYDNLGRIIKIDRIPSR